MFVFLRPLARSIAAAFCASFAFALLGAAPTLPATTLVVFPFRVGSGMDARVGPDYATKLGEAVAALGGVNVVMGDAATVPANYLHVTRADGGDYYLIGSVSPPFNNTASVIQQLVSASSGTVIWSDTAYITPDLDVSGQGSIVKDALVAHDMRGYAAILDPAPRRSPAPAAATAQKKNAARARGAAAGGSGVDQPPLKLPNEAYGFSSAPTAPPKVYASAANPSRFVVLKITGAALPETVRDYAVTSLVAALKHHGQTVAEGDPDSTEFPIVRGPQICKDTGAGYLVFGSITATATLPSDLDNYMGRTDATYKPAVYDCRAQKFEQAAKPLHGGGGNWSAAIDGATNAAVSNYLLKVAPVASSS